MLMKKSLQSLAQCIGPLRDLFNRNIWRIKQTEPIPVS